MQVVNPFQFSFNQPTTSPWGSSTSSPNPFNNLQSKPLITAPKFNPVWEDGSKMLHVSAMKENLHKSPEEMRWEHKQNIPISPFSNSSTLFPQTNAIPAISPNPNPFQSPTPSWPTNPNPFESTSIFKMPEANKPLSSTPFIPTPTTPSPFNAPSPFNSPFSITTPMTSTVTTNPTSTPFTWGSSVPATPTSAISPSPFTFPSASSASSTPSWSTSSIGTSTFPSFPSTTPNPSSTIAPSWSLSSNPTTPANPFAPSATSLGSSPNPFSSMFPSLATNPTTPANPFQPTSTTNPTSIMPTPINPTAPTQLPFQWTPIATSAASTATASNPAPSTTVTLDHKYATLESANPYGSLNRLGLNETAAPMAPVISHFTLTSPTVQPIKGIPNAPSRTTPLPIAVRSISRVQPRSHRSTMFPSQQDWAISQNFEHPKELVIEESDEDTIDLNARPSVPIEIPIQRPTLTKKGYTTTPSLTDMPLDQISQVQNLTIAVDGVGQVTFLGSTDLCGLNLDQLVHINKHEVIVYPDDTFKHPIGSGLNRPAIIVLEDIFPSKAKRSPEVMKRFSKKIEDQTRQFGGKLINYDTSSGRWTFRVEHF
eukprot:TRINITY_DN11571_c0_g1_i1.p1 TRINITY_DN11571_c0_g1~~TRINITY_DN11571_c0_g1_i1.p1  ORF type:complete len:596 (-),score=126.05 TRINITY_DN11571_c0_g1_i1:48-1835(-)